MPNHRVTSLNPWHILFVLDDSGSMSGDPSQNLNESMKLAIDEMKALTMGKKNYFKISVIKFGSQSTILSEAQSEKDIDENNIFQFSGSSGSTNMNAGLRDAEEILKRNGGKDTDFTPYIFLLSDGYPDDEQEALNAASDLKAMTIPAGTPKIITIGLGGGVREDSMKQLASTEELYVHLQQPEDMVRFFPNIGTATATGGGEEAIDQSIINI